jgi:hypothetical protein
MLAFLLRFVSLFALALWVGGGAAISFFVAPVVFDRAGSRSLAGDIVGRVLRRFDSYALTGGSIALAAAFLERVGTVGASRTLELKLALIVAMLGLALYSRFALLPQIHRLRAQLGDIDSVPREDPRRAAFGRLHGFSVLCLMGEMVLGAMAMALAVMSMTA